MQKFKLVEEDFQYKVKICLAKHSNPNKKNGHIVTVYLDALQLCCESLKR